jgi:hypothetical protein
MIVRQRFRGWNAMDSIFTTVSSGHSPQIFASRRRFTAVSDVTGE